MEPDQEDMKVPIPWMAPEVVRSRMTDGIQYFYNTKADVWSFGCLLVELMTGGKIPWIQATSTFKNFHMIASYLSTENARHPIPEGFIDGLREKNIVEQLWKMCFVYDPDNRASFKDLEDYLMTVR